MGLLETVTTRPRETTTCQNRTGCDLVYIDNDACRIVEQQIILERNETRGYPPLCRVNENVDREGMSDSATRVNLVSGL